MMGDLKSEVERLKQNHLETLDQLESTNKELDVFKRNYEILADSHSEVKLLNCKNLLVNRGIRQAAIIG
jgi:hypothetical protein